MQPYHHENKGIEKVKEYVPGTAEYNEKKAVQKLGVDNRHGKSESATGHTGMSKVKEYIPGTPEYKEKKELETYHETGEHHRQGTVLGGAGTGTGTQPGFTHTGEPGFTGKTPTTYTQSHVGQPGTYTGGAAPDAGMGTRPSHIMQPHTTGQPNTIASKIPGTQAHKQTTGDTRTLGQTVKDEFSRES